MGDDVINMVIVVVCTVLCGRAGIEDKVKDEPLECVEKAFDRVIVDDDKAGASVTKDDDRGGFNGDGSGVEVVVVGVVVGNNVVVVVVDSGAHLLILSQSHGAEQLVKQF